MKKLGEHKSHFVTLILFKSKSSCSSPLSFSFVILRGSGAAQRAPSFSEII